MNENKIKNNSQKFGFLLINKNEIIISKFENLNNIILYKNNNIKIDYNNNKSKKRSNSIGKFLEMKKNQKNFDLITENLSKFFMTKNKINVNGIIIGGNAQIILQYLKSNFFNKNFFKYIITCIEILNEGEIGLKIAIKKSLLKTIN